MKKKTRYKYYHVAWNKDMFYRVATWPHNICEFTTAGARWEQSCLDHLEKPSDFVRVSRDSVRKNFPNLFR